MKHYKVCSIISICILIAFAILYDLISHPDISVDYAVTYPEPVIQISGSSDTNDIPSLRASYACVMDAGSHRMLYGKEESVKAPMASTTKIMTAILAIESGKMEDIVTASSYAASMPKVHLGMHTGDQYRMKDMLYSLMLESHNDTAVVIAEHLAGSVERFATLMNDKAKDLEMYDTHFVTPNGLDDDDHYSTAYDMCLLGAYAMQNDTFKDLIQTRSYTFTDVSGRYSYSLTNHDAFLSYYDGALGIKTGFTGNAGYCFVGAASRDDMTLISCVLACGWPPNKSLKWTDTKALMDYGFDNYKKQTLPLQDLSKVRIPVSGGTKDCTGVGGSGPEGLTPEGPEGLTPEGPEGLTPEGPEGLTPEGLTTLLSSSDSLRIEYDLPESLVAPIRKDTAIGEISFYINDTLWKKVNIYASDDIDKKSYLDAIKQVIEALSNVTFAAGMG